MNTEQVVQALVDPSTGVIVRMIDRLGKLEAGKADLESALAGLTANVSALSEALGTLEQGTGKHITILGQQLDDSGKEIAALVERVAALEAKAEAPKRSRKKAEPKPEEPQAEVPQPEESQPEVPQVEPEVVDPEAPAYEPGLVPDEVAGVQLTGKVVLSIRNNIRVLTLQLAKTLNTEYPPELYDFVAGLSEEEVQAINQKFPG